VRSLRKLGSTLVLFAFLLPASMPLGAQWFKIRDKTLPRTSDGKPNLSAPPLRKPDGKPDLSGIWAPEGVKYLRDIAADFEPGKFPIQPWAAALSEERNAGLHASAEPDANCLPQGVPKIYNTPDPFKIIQSPELIAILYESFGQFRQIHLDGRQLPTDPNPAWLGYSIGRWEGDTLVVTSAGFNGKTWLDNYGHPSTDALRVTERLRRRDIGHLEIQFTIDDPKAYTRPWTVTEVMSLVPDTELIEFVCNENEKDVRHLGKP
jgi:hypothetical protein